MVELDGVSKRYGDRIALAPTSLRFEPNQVTALIGPSGCGKSTLLRLVLGLMPPTEGRVAIDGEPMNASTAEKLRQGIGYVTQDGGLFPHLTAEENVLVMGRYLNRPMEALRSRLDEVANLTRFPSDGYVRYPRELSGGQSQRVSLMRALLLQPKLLLLDEPLGSLDPLVRASLQSDLKLIFGELQQTVVFVTHDMGEAAYLADRIVLLQDGRVVQDGALADFQNRPATPFVTDFLNAQRPMVAL